MVDEEFQEVYVVFATRTSSYDSYDVRKRRGKGGGTKHPKSDNYRGTIPNGKNLPLTQFRHLRQLLGRSCSYLLPRQDGGISQNYVNGRFLPFGMVPL